MSIFKDNFRKNGYIVNYYYNPIIALDEYKSDFYDLVILDINIHGMNEFQLYREIRKKDLNSKICLTTAGEMIYDMKKFSSVYNFIRKPIENEELIRTINNLVHR